MAPSALSVAPDAVLSAATAAPPVVPPMPAPLADQYRRLHEWMRANERDAGTDAKRLWALKIPALVFALAATAFSMAKWTISAAIASGIATMCVTIDGLGRFGSLRGIHQQAVFDISMLLNEVQSRWDAAGLRRKEPHATAVELIEYISKEMRKIEEYLRKAESA
jgi:hypothetical protein